MTESTTLTVRLDPEVKQRLESVALRIQRSESLLAAEAIEVFLTIQEWQLAAIEDGIAAAERGELIPQEDVQAWAESLGSGHERPLPRTE
jgi:RHH-type transcriptional regulator, rel operon repressor / antitoxin RelB